MQQAKLCAAVMSFLAVVSYVACVFSLFKHQDVEAFLICLCAIVFSGFGLAFSDLARKG